MKTYADRSLILFPLPILTAMLIEHVVSYFSTKIESDNTNYANKIIVKFRKHHKTILTGFLVAVYASGSVQPLIETSAATMTSFVSENMAYKLGWIKKNYDLEEKPLFVIYSNEAMTGSRGDIWRYIIGTYLGPCYIYHGSAYNLIKFRETNYTTPSSQRWSTKYFNLLTEDKLLSYESLRSRPIFVLDGFYRYNTVENRYLERVGPGVYRLNFESFWADRDILREEDLLKRPRHGSEP